MKRLYSLLLLVAFAAVALEARPTLLLRTMDWWSPSSFNPTTMVATGGDLLVYLTNSGSSQMAVRRRNSEGDYLLVANFTENYASDARTNGKWVALMGGPVTLFSVDASDNTVSEMSTIPTDYGFILSDDTFVSHGYGDVGYHISTYEYDSANNNWTAIAAADLSVYNSVAGNGDWRSYQVTDTHLSFTLTNGSYYYVQIYARQPNKSWIKTDEFSTEVPPGPPGSPFFNGVDTVAYAIPVESFGDYNGVVYLYTKTNGVWSMQQNLTAASVGYNTPGNFGYKCLFLDADTLLISAVFDGYDEGYLGAGRVLMLTRDSEGIWQPVADIDGAPLIGMGMNVNDHDLIISSFDLAPGVIRFLPASKCFHHPINATCNSQQVTDCNDLSRAELYTINNPECGAVDATLLGVSLINNQAMELQFSFARRMQLGTASVSCTTTVTCPAPPVAPVAAVAPVGKVSAALSRHFGVASLFSTLVASLLFFM